MLCCMRARVFVRVCGLLMRTDGSAVPLKQLPHGSGLRIARYRHKTLRS
jgi:hypothetical protein